MKKGMKRSVLALLLAFSLLLAGCDFYLQGDQQTAVFNAVSLYIIPAYSGEP